MSLLEEQNVPEMQQSRAGAESSGVKASRRRHTGRPRGEDARIGAEQSSEARGLLQALTGQPSIWTPGIRAAAGAHTVTGSPVCPERHQDITLLACFLSGSGSSGHHQLTLKGVS